jgi:hypothetical protein
MFRILLFGHSSGFKKIKKAIFYIVKQDHTCAVFILVRFGYGSDAFSVLYTTFMLKFVFLSLVICLLKVYISFNRDII